MLTCAEGHDTSPKVARVEGDIDTGKGNGCESPLKLNVSFSLLLLLCLFEAGLDDLVKHLLDLLDSKLLGQLVKEERMRKVRC